jgi:cytochrome P450
MSRHERHSQPAPPEALPPFEVGVTDNSLARMVELFARHGDTYRVFSPTRGSYTWVIHDAEDIRRVLVGNHRNYTKGVGLDRVRILLGNGIMTSEGDFWRRQRHMMQPLFHRRVIARFAELIATENEALLARWDALAARGERLDVCHETSELTLAIVLRSIFGRDLDRLAADMGGNPFDVVAREHARDLRFAYRFRSLGRLVGALIERRRSEPGARLDYLAMLMDARDSDTGAPMSERELIDEIMTLVVAGHETTASGLNWLWYLLSQHPEAEAKLHAELDAAPDHAVPCFADAEALPFTRAVIDESLRLYPPGWVLSRRSVGPDQLGGYELPPGTDVVFSPYLLHRHPRYWPQPEAFRPERFAAENAAERQRFAYIPFAAGPRHCIGETFAIHEMLVHLCKVARRYRLRLAEERPVELEARVNLRPRHPMFMVLERRR